MSGAKFRSSFDGVKDRVVRVPFRVVTGSQISKANNTQVFTELEIVPANLGSRVAAIAPNFEYYRVERLTVGCMSSVCNAVHYDSDVLNVTLGTLGGYMAVAYEPSDTTRTTAPTTFGHLANAACFNWGAFKNRFTMSVPRSVLFGAPLKWWNTSSTGSPTETLVQGLVWTGSHNLNEQSATYNDQVLVLVEGIIAFKGMIDPTLAAAMPKGVPFAPVLKVQEVDADSWQETTLSEPGVDEEEKSEAGRAQVALPHPRSAKRDPSIPLSKQIRK